MPDNNMASKELPFSIHIIEDVGATPARPALGGTHKGFINRYNAQWIYAH